MISKTRVAILSSGGMDSFLVWADLHARGLDTINVFVDVGQKYRNKERWAWSHLQRGIGAAFKGEERLGMNLAPFEDLTSGIIPNRNAHLILAAASVAPTIALGILYGEINSDKSPEFIQAMTEVLNISNRGQYWNEGIGREHTILTPLAHLTKTEAVAAYLKLGHPSTWLLHTVSCYDATQGHCGECPSCFKRWVALANNQLSQRGTGLDFKKHPLSWARATGVIQKAQDGTYSARRAEEIMQAHDAFFAQNNGDML